MIILKKLMIAEDHIKELNYHDAELYCELLKVESYSDWRIPTITEYKYHIPHSFLDYRWFWTYDAYDNETGIVYHDHFAQQEVDKNIGDKVYIIPVRTI